MFIYPYKSTSQSARALSEALEARIIRHENSRFRGGQQKVVINWGASGCPEEVLRSRVINKPTSVALAGNKLSCFKHLANQGVMTVPYTTDRNMAIQWLEGNKTVVARRSLTGHSGQGIEILEKGLDFIEAPCYTTYIPKTAEYRVHVVRQEVIDVQRKVKDPDREVQDWKVRSHQNGFIFVRGNEEGQYKDTVGKNILELCKSGVRALGLDFGAVDVVHNKKLGNFILEINCAPGLEGASVQTYAEALRKVS